MFFTNLFLLIFLTVVSCETEPPYHYHIPTGNGSYGIDISHYNFVTNWTELVYNKLFPLKFIFTKATEGSDYLDPVLEQYWNNMTSFKEIVSGVYHFYRSDHSVDDNLKNIQLNVFNRISFNHTKHLFAIDFESNYSKRNKKEMAKDLNEFLIRFEKEHNFKPFIYCGAYFWRDNIGEEGKAYNFSDYRLWIANYGPTHPNIAMAWKNYTIWQYTSIENLPGVRGHIDMDWWPHFSPEIARGF